MLCENVSMLDLQHCVGCLLFVIFRLQRFIVSRVINMQIRYSAYLAHYWWVAAQSALIEPNVHH